MVRAVVLATCLAGCLSVGDTPGQQNQGHVDAAPAGNIDAPKLKWVDAAPGTGNNLPCKNLVTAPQLGHHEEGNSCMQSCHNHGFTVAGTIYTSATNNTGFGGSHITLTDNNSVEHDLVVNNDGNFYTKDSVAFPVLVIASSCPSATKMALASSDGNCNKTGCHVGGGSLQMHLP